MFSTFTVVEAMLFGGLRFRECVCRVSREKARGIETCELVSAGAHQRNHEERTYVMGHTCSEDMEARRQPTPKMLVVDFWLIIDLIRLCDPGIDPVIDLQSYIEALFPGRSFHRYRTTCRDPRPHQMVVYALQGEERHHLESRALWPSASLMAWSSTGDTASPVALIVRR